MELTKPTPAAEAAPKTVNDVSAPAQPLQTSAAASASAEKSGELPVHEPTNQPADDAPAEQPAPKQKPTKAKQPKTHTGTGGAIFAAVVIILGLGAMFTYAYLRANNIALF